jgi:hypothetical protein
MQQVSRGSVSRVYAAMLWDGGPVQSWTVMGRLRERRQVLRNHATQARRRQADRERKPHLPAVAFEGAERDAMRASWHGSAELLALLFAPPDSPAMTVLNARKEYFDIRTGEKWSLFFPGYYEKGPSGRVRRDPFIGQPRDTGEWSFDATGFDEIREHVARHSDGRWRYSGNTDLVLIGIWIPEEGEIAIDWESMTSGVLTGLEAESPNRTLGAVIESITNNFDDKLDPTNAISSLANGDRPSHSTMREFTTQALSAVAATLVVHGLGLS